MNIDDLFTGETQRFEADSQKITNLILNLSISNKAALEVILSNQAIILGSLHPQKAFEQYENEFRELHMKRFHELMAESITEITKGTL